MKKIFSIFKNDCKKIFRNIIAFIVIIGLSVLPALYAWFNIASNWNPYDNSGNIDVAVVNLDKGYNLGAIKLNFGNQIVSNLKSNTQMGWKFVDKNTADKGIVDGNYYAVVIISENFSENMVSVVKGNIKQPEITYLVNEKKNAIAPKITDKGIQAIETEVNSSFVGEIANIAAIVLNTSSDKIGENKEEICNKIISALKNAKTDFQTLESSLSILTNGMDSINSAIKSNQEELPNIKEKLEITDDILDSFKNTNETIKSASKSISDSIDNMFSFVESLNSLFENQTQDIIKKINNGTLTASDELLQLTDINNKIIDINNRIINILNKLDNYSIPAEITDSISAVEKSISEIKSLQDSYEQKLDSVFDTIMKDTSKASEKLNGLTEINKKIISTNDNIISLLNKISEKVPFIKNDLIISYLNNINSRQNDIITKIDNTAKIIEHTGQIPGNIKNEIKGLISTVDTSVSNLEKELKKQFDSIKSDISQNTNIQETVSYLKTLNDRQHNIILKIENAAKILKTEGKLPENFETDISAMLNDAKTSTSNFKNNYIDKTKSTVEKVLDKSTDIIQDVFNTINSATDKFDNIDSALTSAQNMVTSIKDAFVEVQTFIDSGMESFDNLIEKTENLKGNSKAENLINKIFDDPEAISSFISSPVKINTEKVFPVQNYGSAMAPFYTVLAFWVGGIVLVAVMKPELSEKDIRKVGTVKPYQEFFGRYLIFMVISLLQSTITVLGDVFFLGVQCDNLILFLFTAWTASIVFSIFIYALTVTFSVIGKAVAVIILIIQVAGSGGTFPPELLPGFFQSIIRFLPFNYGINALRECVAGVNYTSYWSNIFYLLCFIPVALAIGLLLRKPCIKIMKFFNKRLEETDLII